ncbi:hypothetical protein JX265_002839 [Neoarthrinium moseri]|uniref:Uncharacterized protein n=1 Tax=Neoarthrinium moseri TaxID=1658444 RepID=A0A9P9WT49_9PEZI|nr:hypothetical protein JX266_003780 [Neoarthrinium moseri]KAI1878662.1 hypothetical protein JX265_002839 [Neoarthrinium moseri]
MVTAFSPLSALGALVLTSIAYKACSLVWLYTRPSNLHKYLHTTSGKPAWALVTGATAGIGKALADELAAAGFNVVLHGRNTVKLDHVKAELEKSHPAHEFRTLVVDAATSSEDPEKWLDKVVQLVDDLNLTVLVNNAGGGAQPVLSRLEEYSPAKILGNVNLNAVFPTLLTSALIPVLLRNAPGLIINIGSFSDNGLPLVSFYGGAKTFTQTLMLSVNREMTLENRDVEVIAHRVSRVTETDHLKIKPTLFIPTARTAAKAILARTGCGKKSVISYWGHSITQLGVNIIPDWLADRFLINVMRNLRNEQDATKTE